jgi:hypothetical protein
VTSDESYRFLMLVKKNNEKKECVVFCDIIFVTASVAESTDMTHAGNYKLHARLYAGQ